MDCYIKTKKQGNAKQLKNYGSKKLKSETSLKSYTSNEFFSAGILLLEKDKVTYELKKRKYLLTMAIEMFNKVHNLNPRDCKILNNLGIAYGRLSEVYVSEGDLKKAKSTLIKAVEVLKLACELAEFKNCRTLDSLGTAYKELSEIYVSGGDLKKAKSTLIKAIEVLKLACKLTEFKDYGTLNNLGIVYEELSKIFVSEGDLKKAGNTLIKAVEVLKLACKLTEFKDHRTLNNLGNAYRELSKVYVSKGDLKKAKNTLIKVVEVLKLACKLTDFKDHKKLNNLGNAYKNLIKIYILENKPQEAEKFLKLAIEFAEAACKITNYKDFRYISDLTDIYIQAFLIPSNLSLRFPNLKRLLETYIKYFFKKNLTLEYNLLSTESYIVDVTRKTLDLAFLLTWKGHPLTDKSLKVIIVSKSPFMKAFQLIKTIGRNNSLRDILIANKSSSSLEIRSKKEENTSLFLLKSIASVVEKQGNSLARLQVLERFLEAANIKTTGEMQDYIELIRKNLREDEALLFAYPVWQIGKFFFLILWKKGKKLLHELINIETNKKPEFFSEGFEENDIQASYKNFYNKQEEINLLFSKLTKELLSDKFSHIKHVYLLPFGLLNLVSFHALTYFDTSLIERFTISYLTDVELLSKRGDDTTSSESVIFAYDPDRKDVFYSEAKIVKNVLKKHGRKVHYRENPIKAYIRHNLHSRKFEVIYFSTHGKGGFDRPIDSYLLLADGKLTVVDLVDMDFKANVVVLSACEVNLTLSKGVDDASELERAFIVAGAKNVVASLSPVNAFHTKEFLPLFVEKFLRKKNEGTLRSAAEAFREACLEMKKKGLWIWTQFRLTGTG